MSDLVELVYESNGVQIQVSAEKAGRLLASGGWRQAGEPEPEPEAEPSTSATKK